MPFSYMLEAPVALSLMLMIIAFGSWALVDENIRDKHTLIPYDMIVYKEFYRLITSGFIHGTYLHLLFNLMTFYFFAFILEYRVGHVNFLLIYLLGLLISNLATTLRYRTDTSYEGSIGASGAISAVVFAAVISNPYLKFGFPILSDKYEALRIPGILVAAVYLIYTGYKYLKPQDDNINHTAHLWGAIAGIGLTFVLHPRVLVIWERFLHTW
ncbi:rhomboid family intramembrane serine protease [Pontibacter sp. G13]|uniref:rhomboid family intramembrane serine protease n=1 Tax=Pontibacter sp. G13 TaxID=3074898 RepID=UPI00288AB8E0|nr:rhomboid family intramembrane serine protease [Pontibacter sp. G13]WNJ20708.1 rhomboid family intramembrane serine protease [Pontibacter sp. G13]